MPETRFKLTYYQKHRQTRLTYARQYYTQISTRQRVLTRKNRKGEPVQTYRKAYYFLNKEQVQINQKKSYWKHRKARRAYARARYQKIKALSKTPPQ